MHQISFDLPNLGRDEEIQITGLPYTFRNGHVYKLSDNDLHNFRALNPVVSIQEDGSAAHDLGPTLEEAFKDNKYVTVKKGGDE